MSLAPPGVALAERRTDVLPDEALLDGEFDLDVRVLVSLTPVTAGDCPTDDGCGNTCSGTDSSCNSAPDVWV